MFRILKNFDDLKFYITHRLIELIDSLFDHGSNLSGFSSTFYKL